MKVAPFFEEIVELTAAFLDTLGETKTADRLRENYQLPEWVNNQNPILMKGLVKILKEYSRSHTSITNYLETRVNPEQIVIVKPKIEKRKKSEQIVQQKQWMNRFQRPKKLQQLNDLIVDVQQQKPKKKKKAKIIQKQEIESEELDSDSFQLQSKKSKKIQKKQKTQKKKKVKKQIPKEIQKPQEPQSPVAQQQEEEQKFQAPRNPYRNGTNGYKQSFSRINAEEVGRIREELRDNSFQAKQRYGEAGDKWGQYGYDKLKDTRGESFKKTKGKLKNKSFQGSFMDVNKINSIPIY